MNIFLLEASCLKKTVAIDFFQLGDTICMRFFLSLNGINTRGAVLAAPSSITTPPKTFVARVWCIWPDDILDDIVWPYAIASYCDLTTNVTGTITWLFDPDPGIENLEGIWDDLMRSPKFVRGIQKVIAVEGKIFDITVTLNDPFALKIGIYFLIQKDGRDLGEGCVLSIDGKV